MLLQHSLQLFSLEPFFPLGSFQPAPLLGILIDDYHAAARFHDTAHFGNCRIDVHRVLQRGQAVFGDQRGRRLLAWRFH